MNKVTSSTAVNSGPSSPQEEGYTKNMILSPGERTGTVRIPSSKSVVHRLLICAALGEKSVSIRFDGLSKDILATASCLQALGTEVTFQDAAVTVVPKAALAEDVLLPCGESGSTLRFLLPVAGALGAKGSFRMEGRLPERPMQPFENLLRMHGMAIQRDGAFLQFGGQLCSGDYQLAGDISSQYFSGLLMALPLLDGDSRIQAESKPESEGYIRMTEDALALAGITFYKPSETQWEIPGGQHFALPSSLSAEGDWSNAAFFLCMGALSEKGCSVYGLNNASSQGDRAVLEILRRFGANVTEPSSEDDPVTVRRGELRPTVIDASSVPDLVPVLAVLSCGAVGETRIINARRLRMKESDRLAATARLIRDLGGNAEELPDGLVIHGSGALRGGTAETCNDHRIAMSAAVAACLCREAVTVQGAQCVEKSYPAFWDDFERCM